jgi:hypothetical protein
MDAKFERTKTVPELRRQLQHLNQELQAAESRMAAAEAHAASWKRSCEDAWRFAQAVLKTSRPEQT